MVNIDNTLNDFLENYNSNNTIKLEGDIAKISANLNKFIESDKFYVLPKNALEYILCHVKCDSIQTSQLVEFFNKLSKHYEQNNIPSLIAFPLFSRDLTDDEEIDVIFGSLRKSFVFFDAVFDFFSQYRNFYKKNASKIKEINSSNELKEKCTVLTDQLRVCQDTIEILRYRNTDYEAQNAKLSQEVRKLRESAALELFPIDINIEPPVLKTPSFSLESFVEVPDIFESIDSGDIDEIKRICEMPWQDQEKQKGVTAVYHAIEVGKLDIVKYLIEKGADITTRVDSKTPLMLAREKGYNNIVNILISKGVKI